MALALLIAPAASAMTRHSDVDGARWVGMLIVPMMSVFLGSLFGLRHLTTLESLDDALIDAGQDGLTSGQKRYLWLVKTIVLGSVVLFIAGMMPFMLFGVNLDASQTIPWTVQLALVTHLLMSLSLLTFSLLDFKMGVNRYWLRVMVMLLGFAGVAGTLYILIAIDPTELITGS